MVFLLLRLEKRNEVHFERKLTLHSQFELIILYDSYSIQIGTDWISSLMMSTDGGRDRCQCSFDYRGELDDSF